MNLPAFDPLLETAFHCALRASLAASILVLLVVLISLIFRKHLPPRGRYALWLLVMLRLLVPVTPSSSLSLFNLKNRAFPAKTGALPRHITALASSSPALPSPPVTTAAMSPAPSPSPVVLADQPKAISRPTLRTSVRYLWLAGTAGYLLLVLVQHRRLSNWVKRQPPVGIPRLAALVKEGQAMLGLPGEIAVIRAEGQGSPALFRLRRPCLLLPGAALDALEDRELRLVILHELVHVRRRDVLLNWVAIVAQALHWFNPLVWLALKRWRADRELVCDAEVLARLAPPERHTYGATLLKLAAGFSEPLFARSVTPILEHQHEIERRITMIARYKPMPRAAAAALVVSLAALAALTFTRAAEQAPAPKPAQPPGTEPVSEKHARAKVAYLEQELAKIDMLLRKKQDQLSAIKQELRIADFEAAGASLLEPETLRRLETLQIEAGVRVMQMERMYKEFKGMPGAELRHAIMVAYPDAQLAALLENQNAAERKLAELRTEFTSTHPEVQRASNVLHTVNRQTDDRLEGFLRGLKAKLDSEAAGLGAMQKSIGEARDRDIQRARERRRYFEAKRDLETLTALRDRLQMQLIAEKINASLPLNL
jgi:beta-lactamase regulating signal transducer with metallopeptidase domain